MDWDFAVYLLRQCRSLLVFCVLLCVLSLFTLYLDHYDMHPWVWRDFSCTDIVAVYVRIPMTQTIPPHTHMPDLQVILESLNHLCSLGTDTTSQLLSLLKTYQFIVCTCTWRSSFMKFSCLMFCCYDIAFLSE